jgi:4-hydroxy-2-oxoglutarate aldolase
MSKMQIKGVIPPMITPFKENGDLDLDAHIHNILMWNKLDLAGYLVLGSNSETSYLTEEEKLELVRLTVKHANKGKIIIAGTGMESTRETISLTNKVADMGVHAALVLTPFYYGANMNDEAIIKYYTEVADNSKIPILIYNVTKFTHVNISANAVAVLCKHPNIIGMKDSSGDIPQLVKFMGVINDDFNLIVGTASAWYPALTLGVKAGIMALANCAPYECIHVQKAYEAGNNALAREIYLRMFPVNAAVTSTYGIAGLKHSCNKLGFRGGEVRSPLLPLKEDEKSKLDNILMNGKLIFKSIMI